MKIDRKRLGINFIIFFVLLTVAFGGMFHNSFCSDSINHIMDPAGENDSFIASGRFLMALANELLYILGINPAKDSGATCFVGVILFAVCASLLYELFSKIVLINSVFQRMVFTCIIALTVLNPLITDQYFYPEVMAGYTMGMLFIIIALFRLVDKKYLSGFVMTLISVLFYQSPIVVGIILFTGYLFIENKGKLSIGVFTHEFLGVLSIGCAGFAEMLLLKLGIKTGIIAYEAKPTGLGSISLVMKQCFSQWENLMKNSFNTVPAFSPLIFCFVCIIVTVIMLLTAKEYFSIFYYFLVLLVMNISIFLFGLISSDGTIMPPRVMFTVYSMEAMTALIACVCVYSHKQLWYAVGLMVIGYLTLQIVCCNVVVTDHFTTNALDNETADMVYDKICEYEQRTGITVTRISADKDANSSTTYECLHTCDMSQRALYYSINLLRLRSGRNFDRVDMNADIYNKYFKGKDWNYPDMSEQLVFKGDTVYWVLY